VHLLRNEKLHFWRQNPLELSCVVVVLMTSEYAFLWSGARSSLMASLYTPHQLFTVVAAVSVAGLTTYFVQRTHLPSFVT